VACSPKCGRRVTPPGGVVREHVAIEHAAKARVLEVQAGIDVLGGTLARHGDPHHEIAATGRSLELEGLLDLTRAQIPDLA
jgi:hypothetical protein